MNKRLVTALAAYVVLGAIASFVLHGTPLYAVLILFVYFALRSVIAVKGGLAISRNEPPVPNGDAEAEHPDRQDLAGRL